ncbi:polysaccharide pyruvyl transferase family protein [Ketobacter sp.]
MIGIIGISPSRVSQNFGLNACELSGKNFGNLLFTESVYRQINTECKHLGFEFSRRLDGVEKIVIPAANWISPKFKFDGLVEQLEKTQIPVMMLGVGIHDMNTSMVSDIPQSTVRLLKLIEERSPALSVRGERTAEVLNKLGIKKVVVTGCPSMFYHNQVPYIDESRLLSPLSIGLSATRYSDDISCVEHEVLQRELYKQIRSDAVKLMYFQSEQSELAILDGIASSCDEVRLAKYYDEDVDKILDRIKIKGRYHTTVTNWIADSRRLSAYLGSRIHGAVASILSSVPPLLLTHDVRTEELAAAMGVPSLEISKFNFSADLEGQILEHMDLSLFYPAAKSNIKKFMSLYEAMGIPHNLKNQISGQFMPYDAFIE